MDDTSQYLCQYYDGARGTRARPAKLANRNHDLMHSAYRVLRLTKEGREGIAGFMADADPNVRCWAAAHSLEWANELARDCLIEIRESGGECAFEAKLVLDEYDAGRLTFNY